MFKVWEINQMEKEMCNYLDWETTDFETPYPTYPSQIVSKRAVEAASPSSTDPKPELNSTTSPVASTASPHKGRFTDLNLSSPILDTPLPSSSTHAENPKTEPENVMSKSSQKRNRYWATPSELYYNETIHTHSHNPSTRQIPILISRSSYTKSQPSVFLPSGTRIQAGTTFLIRHSVGCMDGGTRHGRHGHDGAGIGVLKKPMHLPDLLWAGIMHPVVEIPQNTQDVSHT
ncbi:hypothetical protein PM082_010394 [Marasmius tenuissimus]|nr:hypothetical protein PM082_010394 [Marasmius tenuissimus]